MRSMVAQSRSTVYRSYANLSQAIENAAWVILQGDDGGQIYLTCPAAKVKCSEANLRKLLEYLDAASWRDIEMASILFEDCSGTVTVAGGMGGGAVTDDVWLHPDLRTPEAEAKVRSFVFGLTQEL
jgi:hypothetical protein